MRKGKKKVSVVITDLDNTLFDWVHVWYASFSAMLEEIVRISGVDERQEERLLSEIKQIHEHHGTSEYSFLIEEIPLLRELHSDLGPEGIRTHYDAAIYAFNKARKQTLALYDGVLHGLMELRASGCLIVAYTESMAFYTRYRMKKLGLDEIVDILYSPKDHDLPKDVTREKLRKYSPESYELKITEHRELERESLKPNARILLDIISDVDADIEETIYIGDSKMKDMVMAQRAGVTSVHAAYGVAHERDEEYGLLKKVTHWTDYQVEMELVKYKSADKPDFTLSKRFDEILDLFAFAPYRGRKKSLQAQGFTEVMELWKKTVDVQQHFNDIEMKIRQYALTIVAAIVGLAGVSLKDPMLANIGGQEVPVASLLLAAAFLVWLAFYFMDRHWYHRLLIGAVNHGRNIERRMVNYFPEIELTEAIGKASPMQIPFTNWSLHSSGKMNLFYGIGAISLLVMIGAVLFIEPQSDTEPLEAVQTSTSAESNPATTPNGEDVE